MEFLTTEELLPVQLLLLPWPSELQFQQFASNSHDSLHNSLIALVCIPPTSFRETTSTKVVKELVLF